MQPREKGKARVLADARTGSLEVSMQSSYPCVEGVVYRNKLFHRGHLLDAIQQGRTYGDKSTGRMFSCPDW